MMWLTTLALLAFSMIKLVTPSLVLAHCPLCAAGAGAGITLSRILGIDDSITGVWIGAFLGSISFWTQRSLGQRNRLFFNPIIGIVIYLLIFISTIWSFYQFNLVGKHGDIFGYDKLMFGIVAGGMVFYVTDWLNKILVRKDGKVFFPYQRMITSLGSMVLLSISVFILINYFI